MLTPEQIAEIRERSEMLVSEWESAGHMRAHYRDDIAALLDHCDRYAALTPEVVETCLHWRDFYVGVHEDYALNESEQDRAARAILESLK